MGFKEGQDLGEGVRSVLFTLLQWADFLYRPETQGAPVAEAPGAFKLTAFELATRLSYMLWGSTPDDKLLDAAAGGALDRDAGLAAEVDRLLADPRAQSWALQFFQQWLNLDGIPSPGQTDKFLAGVSRTGLVDEARRELERFFTFHAFGNGGKGSYKDLMTSPVSFVSTTTPSLEKVYEVTGASGTGQIELPRDRRSGLLTRTGFLLTPNIATSIPHRGDLVVNKLLCSPVPPPNVDPEKIKPPAAEATKTARQGWEALLMRLPECAGCHALLNPGGYALENYDSLGRYRTMETIIDSKGAEIAKLPIDSAIEIAWPDGSPKSRVNGAVELGAAMAQNRGAQNCFAQQWFRFETARRASADDSCLVDDLATTSATEGGLKGMFRRLALAPATRVHRPGK